MPTYLARRPSVDRPLLILGISGVVVIETEPRVPVTIHRISAWERWVRNVAIPDAAASQLRDLAERFAIVWASEWGHNAHTAFRSALALPEDPWPFLPVQFDKLDHIRAYADGAPWAWVDDPVVDLHGAVPDCDDGVVWRTDPAVGIVGLDPDQLSERVAALSPESTRG